MADRLNLGGVTGTVIHAETDGTIFIEEKQDAQGIVDYNARRRNERFSSAGDEFREVCTVPMVVLLQWQKECGHSLYSREFDGYMQAKLRSPEFAALRSDPGLRDPHVIIKGAR